MQEDAEPDSEYLLTDNETWLILLESAFRKETTESHTLAHLLFDLKEAVESGPDGRKQAIATLMDGIGLVYLYTDEHKLALKLYLLSLTGDLKPQHEPLTVLENAIEKGMAEVEQAHKERCSTKGKRLGKNSSSRKKR